MAAKKKAKRRGRPPGSKNKPKPVEYPEPKRRGRPPGSKNKPKPPGGVATSPPKRRGRPPGATGKPAEDKAAARATIKRAPPLPTETPPAEPALAPAGESQQPVADLRVDVHAPERRVLIRVRGDLYQRLVLLTQAQNAHFPPDERLEVAEQASMCLEAGITVCEADPTLQGVQPRYESCEDADYQSALTQACTGRVAMKA